MGFRNERRLRICLLGLALIMALGFMLGCEGSAPAHGLIEPQAESVALESRTVALLLFYDDTVDISTLRTPAQYEEMLFGDGRRAFEAWSLGKDSLTGRVFGWLRVADLAHRSKTELKALAAAAGYDPAAFDITGYILTSYSGGVAVVRNGRGDFTVGAYEETGLILHELLHVCGLGHANKCADQRLFPVSPVKFYGDRHSIMGSNIYGDVIGLPPTAMHREMLGWIHVPVADSSGETKDFALGLYETTGDALKIPRGPRDWFYVERRADGSHVCTVDPRDPTATLWLPELPIVDRVTGIEIHAIPGGVRVTWPGPMKERDTDATIDQETRDTELEIPAEAMSCKGS